MPMLRQAVAGSPMTIGRDVSRNSAGEFTDSGFEADRDFQNRHAGSESGNRKLAALALIQYQIKSLLIPGQII